MSKKERKHIKVTYSTLASPDPLLHTYYEEGVEEARNNFGKTYPLYINGEERFADETFAKVSPIDTDIVMGYFQKGTEADADAAEVQQPRQAAEILLRPESQERMQEAGAPLDVDPATEMVPAAGVVGLDDADLEVTPSATYDGDVGQPVGRGEDEEGGGYLLPKEPVTLLPRIPSLGVRWTFN